MVDRIAADNRIEAGGVEGEFAHVRRRDCGALLHAGGLQVCKQPVLRTRPRSEMLFERMSKEVQRDERCLRARLQYHYRRSASSCPQVEDPSCTRAEKALRRQ